MKMFLKIIGCVAVLSNAFGAFEEGTSLTPSLPSRPLSPHSLAEVLSETSASPTVLTPSLPETPLPLFEIEEILSETSASPTVLTPSLPKTPLPLPEIEEILSETSSATVSSDTTQPGGPLTSFDKNTQLMRQPIDKRKKLCCPTKAPRENHQRNTFSSSGGAEQNSDDDDNYTPSFTSETESDDDATSTPPLPAKRPVEKVFSTDSLSATSLEKTFLPSPHSREKRRPGRSAFNNGRNGLTQQERQEIKAHPDRKESIELRARNRDKQRRHRMRLKQAEQNYLAQQALSKK